MLDQARRNRLAGLETAGFVSVAALITMAAQLEKKGTSVLDFTGFAQKFVPRFKLCASSQGSSVDHSVSH